MEAGLSISARRIANSNSSVGQNSSQLQHRGRMRPARLPRLICPKVILVFERSTMTYDPDLTTKVLGVLETSDDPDAPATSQLIRGMELTICQLVKVLSCPNSLFEGRSEACAFYWNGQQCDCERCGQLATAWTLTAGSVLDTGLGTSIM